MIPVAYIAHRFIFIHCGQTRAYLENTGNTPWMEHQSISLHHAHTHIHSNKHLKVHWCDFGW